MNQADNLILVGAVATWAGCGISGTVDGSRSTAKFNLPLGIAVAPDGTLFVTETGAIRKIAGWLVYLKSTEK